MASNSLPEAPAGYTRTAIALHRLIALLIICDFARERFVSSPGRAGA
jgi:cytochrome b561